MSRSRVKRVLVATMFSALASLAVSAQGKSDDPAAVYKEYLGVLAKATTIDTLLPYFTSELADGMRKMPKDMQANYLKMNQRVVSDVKVTKQTVTETKADLEMTAKDAAGQSLTGTATLVKEGGGWKVDDFAWAVPLPKE
jgi:uncharacterized protein YdaL